jgi:hypothetical protein
MNMASASNIDAQYGGSRATACHWGPAWLHVEPAKSLQIKEPPAVTVDSVATAEANPEVPAVVDRTADEVDNPFPAPEFAEYSELCWAEIYPHDSRYLTAARSWPSPCPWCRGRLHHHPACDELRAESEPKMPFGKHKGRRVSQVPEDYLQWVLKHCTGIDDELRQAIEQRLTYPKPIAGKHPPSMVRFETLNL